MRGSHVGLTSRIPSAGFPFGSLPEGSKLVDVGGGVGTAALILTEAFPNLAIIVQDRPEVINGEARAVWENANPGALASGRVRLEAHDFFQPQPIQDAAVYFLRAVCHDWADPWAIKILKHLRSAGSPESKMILVEQILQPLCSAESVEKVDVEGAAFQEAGEWPLLPVINPTSYLIDMVCPTLTCRLGKLC